VGTHRITHGLAVTCPIHIDQFNTIVNKCLQEARLQGLFQHPNKEFQSDTVRILCDENTHIYKEDWAEESKYQRQTWKEQIINNQQQKMLTNDVSKHNKFMDTMICNLASLSTNISINDLNLNQDMQQDRLNNFTTIERQFMLNNKQREAFQMVTEHSLKDSLSQLQLYVGGPGGTSKSQIIDLLENISMFVSKIHN